MTRKNRQRIQGKANSMQTNEHGQTFAEWLLKQAGRDDRTGALAKQAKANRAFTFKTTPDDLRTGLLEAGAEDDHFEALNDAKAQWLSD